MTVPWQRRATCDSAASHFVCESKLGFSGVSAAAAGIAKVLFGIFVAIFLVLLVLGLVAGEALF